MRHCVKQQRGRSLSLSLSRASFSEFHLQNSSCSPAAAVSERWSESVCVGAPANMKHAHMFLFPTFRALFRLIIGGAHTHIYIYNIQTLGCGAHIQRRLMPGPFKFYPAVNQKLRFGPSIINEARNRTWNLVSKADQKTLWCIKRWLEFHHTQKSDVKLRPGGKRDAPEVEQHTKSSPSAQSRKIFLHTHKSVKWCSY